MQTQNLTNFQRWKERQPETQRERESYMHSWLSLSEVLAFFFSFSFLVFVPCGLIGFVFHQLISDLLVIVHPSTECHCRGTRSLPGTQTPSTSLEEGAGTVSYTHLTLPTSVYV